HPPSIASCKRRGCDVPDCRTATQREGDRIRSARRARRARHSSMSATWSTSAGTTGGPNGSSRIPAPEELREVATPGGPLEAADEESERRLLEHNVPVGATDDSPVAMAVGDVRTPGTT